MLLWIIHDILILYLFTFYLIYWYYFRFRAGMKDLEVMMINAISSAFETIGTVEQGVELLDIFMHLQVREVCSVYTTIKITHR